ncbi:hypothetical protein [Xenorhabdus stockiae]|uniref:hypothetical protein n=1 Tax=Xenorhabdus stockiae TaxID=351614 RepID=UPI003CF28FF9
MSRNWLLSPPVVSSVSLPPNRSASRVDPSKGFNCLILASISANAFVAFSSAFNSKSNTLPIALFRLINPVCLFNPPIQPRPTQEPRILWLPVVKIGHIRR